MKNLPFLTLKEEMPQENQVHLMNNSDATSSDQFPCFSVISLKKGQTTFLT